MSTAADAETSDGSTGSATLANNVELEIIFQFGNEKDNVYFDGTDVEHLKELAEQFICTKFEMPPLAHEMILLFRHNYLSSNYLDIVENIDQLRKNDVVEIVLRHDNGGELEIRPHMLYVHSYKSPTFCDLCAVMLFGLVRQGLKCEGCGGNFHKKCAFKIASNCSGVQGKQITAFQRGVSYNDGRRASDVSEQWSIHGSTLPANISAGSTEQGRRYTLPNLPQGAGRLPSISSMPIAPLLESMEIPHTFVVHTYRKPTMCLVCRKLVSLQKN